MSAIGHQAATDEGHVGQGIEKQQLAHGVADQHLRAGANRLARRAAHRGKAFLARQFKHRDEAFRMPWYQEQQGLRKPLQQASVRGQDDFVLAGMGAGGDPQRPILRRPLIAQIGRPRQQCRVDGQVELDRASHFDAFVACAELAKTLGFSLCLHGDQAQLGQHWRDQPGEARIAAGRTFGQPRVGQRHGYAASGALMDMVGPELGLHHHRQLRLQAIQKTRRGPGQVIGQVAMLHAVSEQRLDALGAGRGHAGDGDRQVRVACHQLADHRRRGDAFAHRDRMHPDATRTQPRQTEGETLADTTGVGRGAPGAPQQAQEHQRQAEVKQQGIEGAIHGRGA